MESLLNFLHDESISSPFRAELSNRGGYITFSNSGRRGDTKYFQIGIDSILTTLKDILNNISVFSRIQDYDEKPWRDNGSIYFSDPVANANSTVQTKPLFSTLSKIIKWANQPILNNLNSDNRISITPDSLENAINKLNAVADSFIPHSNSKIVKSPLDEPLQVIYYGAPGTGKSFTIDDKTDDKNSVRTTFHPDSDYASFVGAYKPTMENVPINSIYGESVQFATGKNGHPGTEKKIVYKYVPQAFLKAYVAAWSNLDTPYFLIIEEINRGNCAQIFGDLFQLLDRNNAGSSSYAIHADEDITQFLSSDSKGFASLSDDQKDTIRAFVLHKDNGKTQALGQDILDGKLLLLPPNLYIWATMNTSDQSLFPIDSAFKRRWNWKYMPIEYHPIDTKTQQPIDWNFQIGDNIYSWGQFLSKINPEIYTLTESSDKQMGYFFAKADNATGIISEDVFLNKVLFYLWTDVFKDFDVSSELFKNKDKNRSFIFTDFFDKDQPHALANLMANFKLDIVDVDINSIEDEDSSEGEAFENSQSQRDLSRYSINGEGKNNKRQTVLRSLRKYIEANPSLTAAEVIDKWKKVNPQLPYFILSASDYEARIADLPNQRDRFWSVTTGDGEKVYITNQWNANRINELMRLVNSSDLGLNIEKVPE
jgi:GTPase subunit of restriction endonuclease